MEFCNLKVKKLDFVVRYKATVKKFSSSNNHHIIGLKLSGRAFHDFGFQSFTLEENCIYFLNQKEKYTVEMEEFGEVISVHFTTYEPIDTNSFCIKIRDRKEILRLLEKLELQASISGESENQLLSTFYNICGEFDKLRKKSYTGKDKRLTDAKEFIDLHYKEENCFREAVNLSGMSQRHFGEIFKNQFGITPYKYIMSKKIELAKKLLKTQNISITDICPLCGFGDIYYFSKVFKSETGVTPTQYRKNFKNVGKKTEQDLSLL